MPITSGYADPAVRVFSDLASLPPRALALLSSAPDVFGSSVWWSVVLAHAVPGSAGPAFVLAEAQGRSLALLPMLRQGGRLSSLTTPYSCVFTPCVADDLDPGQRLAGLTACIRYCRSVGVTRLDALPAEGPWLSELRSAARCSGLVPLTFDHFGNWYEDVAGLDWAAYLRLRPGALRETVRRRLRKAETLAGARFELLTRPTETDRGTDLYESVYRRSWKQAEPFPDFNPALIRATAEAGWLQLGIWSIGAEPVAVQFWVVKDGHATVLKLAHDEAFKAHSPGTVLTALMLRHLLDEAHVAQIDFGRGDDPYKQGWASNRRQRIGLLLANPRRAAGMATLVRQCAGRLRQRLYLVRKP